MNKINEFLKTPYWLLAIKQRYFYEKWWKIIYKKFKRLPTEQSNMLNAISMTTGIWKKDKYHNFLNMFKCNKLNTGHKCYKAICTLFLFYFFHYSCVYENMSLTILKRALLLFLIIVFFYNVIYLILHSVVLSVLKLFYEKNLQ